MNPRNQETKEPRNHETKKLRNQGIEKLSNQGTKKPRNQQTTKPRSPPTPQQSDSQPCTRPPSWETPAVGGGRLSLKALSYQNNTRTRLFWFRHETLIFDTKFLVLPNPTYQPKTPWPNLEVPKGTRSTHDFQGFSVCSRYLGCARHQWVSGRF